MAVMRAMALYEFRSSAAVELRLDIGDIIIVRSKDAGEGWCEGELNGKIGLFPKTFVKMLDEDEETTDSSTSSVTGAGSLPTITQPPPLTPMSSKKVFMETLLTPTPNTIEKVFNSDKAAELFMEGHRDILVESGPRWKHRPPSLTISVFDDRKHSRTSGLRLHKSYDIRTKELKTCVQRKYKHFLWLYDQMAEKFPCISLPPLPIKHAVVVTGNESETTRRCLERFLNRVARHPVLGSTKTLNAFLTATDEKEWRIGRHTSMHRVSGSKNIKKLFAAPIYNTVQYPPYNVPLNQLASIEKFSKFSDVMETNVGNMTRACETLKTMHGQMAGCVRSFGKDLQNLATGADQPGIGARYRKPSQGVVSMPSNQLGPNVIPLTNTINSDSEGEEESEHKDVGEWNWREDETFTLLMTQFHDLGSRIRQTSLRYKRHQEQLQQGVIEGLEEYSGIMHTLPVLVKLHEEAMGAYNDSKQKGSKKEAEDVRQDCETLNNIILSEFDYFSDVMIEDFQSLLLTLMKNEAEYHKKLAADWENLFLSFSENRPVRKATIKRSTTVPGSTSTNDSFIQLQQQHRPASSGTKEEKGGEVSTTPGQYVNLEGIQLDKINGLTDEHIYANIPAHTKLSYQVKNTAVLYENWQPGKTSTTSSIQTSSSSTPHIVNSPIPNKPIPPPLILRRHEISKDPQEAVKLGNQTDSFIVPNLPHYSQVSVGDPIDEFDEEEKPEEKEVVSQIIPQKDDSPVNKHRPIPHSREQNSPSLGGENPVSGKTDVISESSGEIDGELHQTTQNKDEGTVKKEAIEESNKSINLSSQSSYSPQLHTKLAKLTQLPNKNGISPTLSKKPGPSKSFTQHQPKAKVSSMRSLPRGAKLPSSKSLDEGGSELLKKLKEQRNRLERQMSGEIVISEHRTVLSHNKTERYQNQTDGKDSDTNNLSKFGIIEDEQSGSYIV